jgi:transcriptional regulator with XRE-family HTH domain
MAGPDTEPFQELGGRIRSQRHALGLSQERLAERADLHWSYIGQVERGKHDKNGIGLVALLKLAAALELDPARLVEGLRPPG